MRPTIARGGSDTRPSEDRRRCLELVAALLPEKQRELLPGSPGGGLPVPAFAGARRRLVLYLSPKASSSKSGSGSLEAIGELDADQAVALQAKYKR